MDSQLQQRIALALEDKPVEDKQFLVNRERELELLERAAITMKGSIIGVAGERGIGKTSLLNIFREGKRHAFVRVFQKDSLYTILYDILYSLQESLGREYGKLLEQLKVNLSLSFPPSASVEVEKVSRPVREVVDGLRKALDKEDDVVIVIDELDKERYDELMKVLDALRFAFEGHNTTVVMALPPSVYDAYVEGLVSRRETFNAEGLFRYIVPIHPLKREELRKIVELRLGELAKYIDEEALDMALSFARGNPRVLLHVLSHGVMYSERGISKEGMVKALSAFVAREVSRLSPKEVELLKLLGGEEGKRRSEVVEALVEKGWGRNSAYVYLNRLTKGGWIEWKKDLLHLTYPARLALDLGLLGSERNPSNV